MNQFKPTGLPIITTTYDRGTFSVDASGQRVETRNINPLPLCAWLEAYEAPANSSVRTIKLIARNIGWQWEKLFYHLPYAFVGPRDTANGDLYTCDSYEIIIPQKNFVRLHLVPWGAS